MRAIRATGPAFVRPRLRRVLPILILTYACWPTAARAASVAARVVDPDGRPVPAARVVATTASGTTASCITGNGGSCELDHLATGDYQILVVAPGFQSTPVALALAGDENRRLDIGLQLSALSEAVVVSASAVDLPLSRAGDAVTIVPAETLRAAQAETASDALRLVPGLAVVRSGGRGALTSIFPRGGNSNYTLVLVDGIRANDFGGGYDFAHLSVSDVDRIEIVRGPESAVFGADAIGGVVQIVTRRGGPLRANGLAEGGSESTARLAADASGGRGRWRFGAGAERSTTGGYDGIAPADGSRVTNADDRFVHANGSAGWQAAGGLDALVTGRFDRSERGLPGPYGSDPAGLFPGVDRVSRSITRVSQAGGRLQHPWNDVVRERFDANYTDVRGDFTGPYGASFTSTRRAEARVQEDAAISPSIGATAGAAFLREDGSSTFITGGPDASAMPIRRSNAAVFAELRLSPADRVFLTGGVRAERLTRDALPPSVDPYSPRPAFASQDITSVNPKAALTLLLSAPGAADATRLRVSAGTGIRPPDAFEIAFTDNANLKPERSRSVAAGLEQTWGGGKIAASATGFVNRYDDLIVSIGRSLRDASHFRSDNVSNAEARGLELAGDARLTRALTLHATYTWLDSRILAVDGLAATAPPPFHVGDALLRRPRHQGSAHLTYVSGRISAFAEATTRGRALDVEPNYGATAGLFFSDGHAVANAGASVRLGAGLEIFGRVMNLADRHYEEVLGYPALPRTGMVGLRIAAGR